MAMTLGPGNLVAAPNGWKLVPPEITEPMIRALNDYAVCAGYIEEGYQAMLKAAPVAAPSGEDNEDWRDDPSADERWNAGCDFAMTQLCGVLGLDPKEQDWDAATETLDGDVSSVIGRFLEEALGENWQDRVVIARQVKP